VLLADPAVNANAAGMFYGNPKQLWIQVVSILGTVAYTAVVTLVVVAVTRAVTGGLRVDAESEVAGLDNALHGERAFEIQ
jgi:Amt family ammonium transporter